MRPVCPLSAFVSLFLNERQPRLPEVAVQDLLRVVAETSIMVRILPFTLVAPPAFLSPFIVLDLDDGSEPILYREAPTADEIVVSAADADRYSAIFERLWPLALGDDESRTLLAEEAAQWRMRAES